MTTRCPSTCRSKSTICHPQRIFRDIARPVRSLGHGVSHQMPQGCAVGQGVPALMDEITSTTMCVLGGKVKVVLRWRVTAQRVTILALGPPSTA